ncbi:MAG: succinate dehydrogenase/fumarate reductase cytochrome b subunit [Tannerella sp.]|jgi:succinate dehydrogenase / fumarate reductase cytochrome b subunit|nr:succinate dehydrogenase/fumarate reductase cytochrome b subunit [Tannerella sp.]
MWLLNSSIGRKLVMSLSGLFLILFLLFHLAMNMTAVFSEEAYNLICELLGSNWYAIAGTLLLAAGFAVHILYALWLTWRNLQARGSNRYAVSERPDGVEWSSQNMFVLGLVVVGFLLLHFLQFWYHMMFAELMGHHETEVGGLLLSTTDGAGFVRYYFSNIIVVVLYLVWYAALWLHLTHGFWSALQTVGWSNNLWFKRWKVISDIFATVVCLGFAFVTITFYIKSIL